MDLFSLEHKINDLVDKFENPEDPELAKLLTENSKLKYRLNHLNKSISKEQAEALGKMSIDNFSISSPLQLTKLGFSVAISNTFPEIIGHQPIIDTHKDENSWDYFCNSALAIGKQLKRNAKEVAAEIINNIPSQFKNLIDKIEIAGPGFINIRYKTDFYKNRVLAAVKNNLAAPRMAKASSNLLIDYSAPNIAKDMHVGHLRSTIIGDALGNFFEYLGYNVTRLNHIGDWGTQFGMLIAHLQDEYPDYAKKSPSIADLEAFYKASKKRFDDDEPFKKRAYENVVKLQAYDKEIYNAWQAICQASRENYTKIYNELNISKNLKERGESFYNKKMKSLMAQLSAQGNLTEDEGRKIYFPKGCEIPLTLIKSDGGYTYDTSDLACLKQRVSEENADVILYVTDAGQATHFQVVFAAARELGIYDPEKVRVEHVPFGVVLGQDKKKFKTRSGETVKLKSLLDEGQERVGELMLNKRKEEEKSSKKKVQMTEEEFSQTRHGVAISSIKYSDLSSNREKAYIFNYDKMLAFNGNTGTYLLYTYTRIRSIARNVGQDSETIRSDKFIDQVAELKLSNPEERKLAKKVTMWYDKIITVEKELYPHVLCSWLYDMAKAFTDFYDKHYIREERDGKVTIYNDRLLVCEITAVAFERAFEILGFLKVEKM